MLKGNLITWSNYRWNIEKWVFRKLMSLTFLMKKLRNSRMCGVKKPSNIVYEV